MTNKPDTLPEGRLDLSAGASAEADQALLAPLPEPVPVSALSGNDPSRTMKVGSHTLSPQVLRAGVGAMCPGKGIDYFELWDVTAPLMAACNRRGLNATYVASRLLQRARRDGYVRHRGRGQWVRCDSDEHPEGENAKRLSGEAMPARAEGIAPPHPQSLLNQEKPK